MRALLKHLSETFLGLEKSRRTLTGEEIDEMFAAVSEKVCGGCERKSLCLGEGRDRTRQMVYEIMAAAEEYGAELNVELRGNCRKSASWRPVSCGRRWKSFRRRSRRSCGAGRWS